MRFHADIVRAVDYYGKHAQQIKCIEELAELIQAISKHSLNQDPEAENRRAMVELIKDEIADVYIMLEQMKYILDIPPGDLDRHVTFKLTRLKKRIDAELDGSFTQHNTYTESKPCTEWTLEMIQGKPEK